MTEKTNVQKVIESHELEAHTKNGWQVIQRFDTQITQIGSTAVRNQMDGNTYYDTVDTTHVLTVTLFIVGMKADLVGVEEQLKETQKQHAADIAIRNKLKLDLEHMTNYRDTCKSNEERELRTRQTATRDAYDANQKIEKLIRSLGKERINEILGIKPEEGGTQ